MEPANQEGYVKYFGDLEPKTNYVVSKLIHVIPNKVKSVVDNNGALYASSNDIITNNKLSRLYGYELGSLNSGLWGVWGRNAGNDLYYPILDSEDDYTEDIELKTS